MIRGLEPPQDFVLESHRCLLLKQNIGFFTPNRNRIDRMSFIPAINLCSFTRYLYLLSALCPAFTLGRLQQVEPKEHRGDLGVFSRRPPTFGRVRPPTLGDPMGDLGDPSGPSGTSLTGQSGRLLIV